MANITITGNVTVDIHLENISMEAYNRLTAFLASIETQKDKEPDPVKPVGEAEDKTLEKGKASTYKLKTSGHSRPVYELLIDAKAHPERYDWRWMMTQEIAKAVPDRIVQTNARSVGHMIGRFVTAGMLEKRRSQGGLLAEFRFPVMKAESAKSAEPPSEAQKSVNWRDQEAGEALRKARKSADMTLSELSKAIGYSEDIIKRWETGCYHMVECQRKAVCDCFHKDIFAEAAAMA